MAFPAPLVHGTLLFAIIGVAFCMLACCLRVVPVRGEDGRTKRALPRNMLT